MLLHNHLDHWAAERPDGEFAVHGARSLTWRQARRQADRTANALVGLGLPVGARVAVLAKNCIEYLVLYYAASKAWVVPVPLNYRSAPPEWAQTIGDSDAALVIADGGHTAAVDALRRELPEVAQFAVLDGPGAAGWASLLALAAIYPATPPDRRVGPDDDVYQLYTSGTTGRPKGAVLTHRAVTANCAQITAMPHRGAPGERALVVAPLCHAGVVWGAFAPQYWGASVVLHTDFDPAAVVAALATDRIGYAALVPSILQCAWSGCPTPGSAATRTSG